MGIAHPGNFSRGLKTSYLGALLELVDLLVAELDRCFNQPGMNKLLVIEHCADGDSAAR